MKTTKRPTRILRPGGVIKYISKHPQNIQGQLRKIREAIRLAAPGAIETLSYFNMPGYSYPDAQYDYNGMFAWFSYKAPFVRLHVRPEALARYKQELRDYRKTKAVVSFSLEKPIPKTIVKKLVKASIKSMKEKRSGRPN